MPTMHTICICIHTTVVCMHMHIIEIMMNSMCIVCISHILASICEYIYIYIMHTMYTVALRAYYSRVSIVHYICMYIYNICM